MGLGPSLAKWTLGCGLGVVVACTLAYPLDEYRTQAVASGGPAQVDAGPDACGLGLPGRPTDTDAADGPDLYFAISAIEVGSKLPKLTFERRNLDGLCTCAPDNMLNRSACKPPGTEREFCDIDIGVDNAGGDLLDEVLQLAGGTRSFTDSLLAGSSGLAIRVRKYNGKPNDPDVEVMVVPVVEQTSPLPKWDGTDVRNPNTLWLTSATPTLVSTTYDAKAFVRDGVLVASFSGEIPFGDFVLKTVDFRLAGKLEGGLLRQGNLMFRSPAGEFVRSLAELPGKNPDAGTCSGPIFDAIKSRICTRRDLPIDPKQDGTDAPCAAVSFTFRFDTQKISLGEPRLGVDPRRQCGPTLAVECNP